MTQPLDRRRFLAKAAVASLSATLIPDLVSAQDDEAEITTATIARAEELAGVQFSEEERELMADSVNEHLGNLKAIVEMDIGNEIPPAMTFFPRSEVEVSRYDGPSKPDWDAIEKKLLSGVAGADALPEGDDLAFASVGQLAALIRARRISCTDLTKFYLERLKRLDEQLLCVISFTEERALEQAAKRDEELKAGVYRGPLHGIPWGAKDLLAVPGYKTTWGATPYKDQVIDQTAVVVERLDEAGAILIAKTTVGALAWGDVWYGGTTKNPWNLEQGSSGSSAGSASAVAAGGLPFALGTETLGSIVSPCSRCGATGLRPTFGRVPRTGCMALSWSMDKIGPIARHVEDAALVLSAIHGADGHDLDAVTAPLHWHSPSDLGSLRFGITHKAFEKEYDESAIDAAAVDVIRGMGVELTPIELPEIPVGDLMVILEAESAAAFDDLTRSGKDDELVRQVEQAWPNAFRAAQLVPAVQYIQAQRARTVLIRRWESMMADLDGYVAPSFVGRSLLDTNLTGHPTVVLPNGFRENGTPTSISFVGRNYGEGAIAALGAAYQRTTEWNRRRPGVQ